MVACKVLQALYQILPAGGWIGWNVGLGSWKPLCCVICSRLRETCVAIQGMMRA
ncbi:uncharacterized protein FFMR_02913 [Fusarium fujikuroi]|nr:uncharacterized protein FFMR_02913 [Fusarium fujikuroi]